MIARACWTAASLEAAALARIAAAVSGLMSSHIKASGPTSTAYRDAATRMARQSTSARLPMRPSTRVSPSELTPTITAVTTRGTTTMRRAFTQIVPIGSR